MKLFENIEERQWLVRLLQTGVVKVTFVKKDGSTREMNCTLREDLLRDIAIKKDHIHRFKNNQEILIVFDVDIKQWRSFLWDSIVSIHVDLDNPLEV